MKLGRDCYRTTSLSTDDFLVVPNCPRDSYPTLCRTRLGTISSTWDPDTWCATSFALGVEPVHEARAAWSHARLWGLTSDA
eukprot:scaffold249020_cov28-Tisochrysis_lutea.AAC.7